MNRVNGQVVLLINWVIVMFNSAWGVNKYGYIARLFVTGSALVLLIQSPMQVTGNILFVSKAFGNDGNGTNNCTTFATPCQTLSHAVSQALPRDTIRLDSRKTTKVPYNSCPTKKLWGSLSFSSWSGFATINCTGGRLSFQGTDGMVEFTGLKFLDTRLQFNNTSVTITNCSFTSLNTTYLYAIELSANNLNRNLTVNMTSVNFLDKNSVGSIKVVAERTTFPVFVLLTNVAIINNILEKANSTIWIQGYVHLFLKDSVILNTTFTPISGKHSLVYFAMWPRKNMQRRSAHSLQTHISMQNCTFRFNRQGLMVLIMSPHLTLLMTLCTFALNHGGALYIVTSSDSHIVVKSSSFHASTSFYDLNTQCGSQVCVRFGFDDDKDRKDVPDEATKQNFADFSEDKFLQVAQSVATLESNKSMTIESKQNQQGMSTSNEKMKKKKGEREREAREESKNVASSKSISERAFENSKKGEIMESLQQMIAARFQEISPRSSSGLRLEHCQFHNNTNGIIAGAAALEAYGATNDSKTQVIVKRCEFVENTAHFSTGGIYAEKALKISDSLLKNNAGPNSGAIYFRGMLMVIENCILDSNYGGYSYYTQATGSVRMTRNDGRALIRHSQIIQRRRVSNFTSSNTYHGGLAISSQSFGSITLSNCSLDYLWLPSSEETIILEIAHTSQFMLQNGTTIQCPLGYDIRKNAPSNTGQSFQCIPCLTENYSIDRGVYGKNRTHHAKCFSCPYGGKCTPSLQALPDFWGYKTQDDPPQVAFSRCPLGYCCQANDEENTCVPYDMCNSVRHGRLCGTCRPGFSESLFTPSCRKDEKCKDFWFWPMAVVFVLAVSLYLIIQPDLAGFLHRSVTWCKKNPAQQFDQEHDKSSDPGFERIVFFFYQALDILTGQNSSSKPWDGKITQFILGLFNFDLRLNREGFACPFPGLSAVTKLFFQTLGVFSVLFAIPLLFLLHKCISFCSSCPPPKSGVYLAAFFKAVFLGYAVLARKSLMLLKCVEVDGVNCLFVNCTIVCYTWWQTLVGTLFTVSLLPFTFVLYFGSKKLYHKEISVLHFFLACFFPLPYLSYWFLHRRHFQGKFVPDTEGRTSVVSLLIGSYRVPDHASNGAIYWESVLLGRTLLLIFAVLIREPLLQTLALLLLCVLNLTHHVYVQPFKRVAANRAEAVSLFSLLFMPILNLPFTTFLSGGVMPSGSISHLMKIFSWCQAILVTFLPLIGLLVFLVAVISQTTRLIFLIPKGLRFAWTKFRCPTCCRSRQHEELFEHIIST